MPTTYTARAEQSDSAGNVGQSAPTTFTIPSDYRAAVMADNPRAYWRLGEQTGTTAVDQVGVNHGTYSNVALGSTGPLTGDDDSAASFDGTTAYATAPDSNSLDLSSGATIEAWVKRTKSSVWQIAVGKGGDGQSKNENYSLWISPFDKAVSFFGNGTTFVRVESAAALDTDWHYVVSTYDNATGQDLHRRRPPGLRFLYRSPDPELASDQPRPHQRGRLVLRGLPRRSRDLRHGADGVARSALTTTPRISTTRPRPSSL